ncbi:hypothetical protein [Paenibacillus abyssi]|uniref:Uncharacterized protein n=1 Tax=Paenibacillus abyssi TaxID=1340531 RepID=A0A917LEM0_9BACL|nr:hypothetical protein [Paenibacillus abyssi]GGG16403.1 hypothetical protein GCM10010916_36620 [Paenibacillus abyssi]
MFDQKFAVAFALQSKDKLQVEAMYAAPFFNELSSALRSETVAEDSPQPGKYRHYSYLQ